MIKKFKLYILLAAMAFSAASCLDKMPEDGIPFDESIQTVDDVNLAVIGIYDAFKSSALYSGNLTILPDLQADLVYGVNGNTNTFGDIWRWKDILATNTSIEAVYAGLYNVINRCNFMLDRVDRVRNNTTDDKDLDKLDQCWLWIKIMIRLSMELYLIMLLISMNTRCTLCGHVSLFI